MSSIYLIAPRPAAPGIFGAEVLAGRGYPPLQFIGDVTVATVAALAPPGFSVEICDEALTPVDFDTEARFVGITGKITQGPRMIRIAEEFRRRGKIVLFGGPYASLSPDSVRESCDILVRGEVEEIAGDLFGDLASGRWKDEYVGGRPDLDRSPQPRWDLYPNRRTLIGAVQTSRGCPFDCEFCDVIQYLGRKQRHKPVGQVLGELDILYELGYADIFLSDDNFTVYRSRAKELLSALGHWNDARDKGQLLFSTQASIDVASDDDMLRLCAEAGLTAMFIGLETPNEDSLRETRKRQNLLADPVEQVRRILSSGISIMSGMIVGFDSDGPDIFGRQFEFSMANPIPIFSIGALTAPEATPLYARMRDAGRLVVGGNETAAIPWATNIAPAAMSPEQMSIGMKWLVNRIYRPDFFGERVFNFMNAYKPGEGPQQRRAVTSRADIFIDTAKMIRRFLREGKEEMKMAQRIEHELRDKPELESAIGMILLQYAQVRHVYGSAGYWDPAIATHEAPPF